MTTDEKTREAQYQFQLAHDAEHGRAKLGLMTSAAWHQDPRRLLFLFSRYKFVAKMFTGKKRVLEVGCGDALGTRMVLAERGLGLRRRLRSDLRQGRQRAHGPAVEVSSARSTT